MSYMKFFGTTTAEVHAEIGRSAPTAILNPTMMALIQDDATDVIDVCIRNGVSFALYGDGEVLLFNKDEGKSRTLRCDPDTGVLLMTMDEAKDPFIRNRLLLWDQWLKSQKPLEVTNA